MRVARYINIDRASTDVFQYLGLDNRYDVLRYGVERYTGNHRKAVVSINCYMVELSSIPFKDYHPDDGVIPNGSDPREFTASVNRHGMVMVIENYCHQITGEQKRHLLANHCKSRFGIGDISIDSDRRDELILTLSEKNLNRCGKVASAFQLSRVFIASMMDIQGICGAEVDFVLMDEINPDVNQGKSCVGMAMMCKGVCFSTFIYSDEQGGYTMLTKLIHGSGTCTIEGKAVTGSTAKDIVRHLTPVLLKIVEAAGE